MGTAYPSGREDLLEAMLIHGFENYQKNVARMLDEPVNQCIHHAEAVSVSWLHLHTFCLKGKVDGMPNARRSFCYKMSGVDEARSIAKSIVTASRQHLALQHKSRDASLENVARAHDALEWIN